MMIEVIVLYILRSIVAILGILEANIALKYFNQKALGMQTIFDEMIKDKINLSLLSWSFTIVIDVALEYAIPLNHYVAVAILLCHEIFIISEFWQIIIIAIIRYLSVFHHPLLNLVDESLLKRTTRIFVVFISTLSALTGSEGMVTKIVGYVSMWFSNGRFQFGWETHILSQFRLPL